MVRSAVFQKGAAENVQYSYADNTRRDHDTVFDPTKLAHLDIAVSTVKKTPVGVPAIKQVL